MVLSGQPELLAQSLSPVGARTLLRHWAGRLMQPRRWFERLRSAEARREFLTRLGQAFGCLYTPSGHGERRPL